MVRFAGAVAAIQLVTAEVDAVLDGSLFLDDLARALLVGTVVITRGPAAAEIEAGDHVAPVPAGVKPPIVLRVARRRRLAAVEVQHVAVCVVTVADRRERVVAVPGSL